LLLNRFIFLNQACPLLFKDAGQNVDVILPDDTVVTLRTLLELIYTGNTLAHDSILLKKIDTLSKVVGFPFEKLVISNVPYTAPLVESEELDTYNEDDDIESHVIDYVDDETNWLEGTTNNDQENSSEDTPALVDECTFEVNDNAQVCIPTEDHTSDTTPLSSNVNTDSPSNMDSVFKETTCRLCQKTFHCPSLVIQHLSSVHYNTEIRANFGQHYNLKTKRCQLCQRSIGNMTSFISHIGAIHKISLKYYKMEPEINFVEPEIGVVPINIDENFSPEGSIDGSDLELSNVQDFSTDMSTSLLGDRIMSSSSKASRKQLGPKCQVCGKINETKYFLLQHMAKVHFQTQIKRDYSEALTLGICPMCNKRQKDIPRFVSHIGATHRKVYDYLDNENATNTDDDEPEPEGSIDGTAQDLSNVHDLTTDMSSTRLKDSLMSSEEKHNLRRAVSATKSYECYICTRNHDSKPHLFQHMSMVHFQTQIKRDYSEALNSMICPLCGKHPKDLKNFVIHMGATHRKVLDYFDNENATDAASAKCMPSQKKNPNQLLMTKEKSQPKTYGSAKSHVCHYCKKKEPNSSLILQHLSVVHFHDRLMAKYGQTFDVDRTCQLCGKVLPNSSVRAFLWHIGGTHGKALDLLKEDGISHNIVKTMRGRKNKWMRGQTNKRDKQTRCEKKVLDQSQTQHETNGSAQSYECHICKKTMSSASDILRHLSGIHFCNRLMAKYGQTFHVDRTCQLCGKVQPNSVVRDFAWHIGCTHGKALDLLEEDGISHNIVKIRYKGRRYLTDKFQELQKEEQTNAGDECQEKEYLQCPDCEHSYPKRSSLVRHLVTAHYFTLMASKYEDQLKSNNMSCFLCEKKFDYIWEGLFHLAFKHEKLEEFVNCPQIMKPVNTKAIYKVKINPPPAAKESGVANSGALSCPACFITLPKAVLQTHISQTHHERQLWGKYEKDYQNGRCGLCDKEISSKESFIRHVGITHRKVLIFVPPPKRSAYIRCLPTISSQTIIPSINGGDSSSSGNRTDETGSSFANSMIEPQPVQLENRPRTMEDPMDEVDH
jgi:predicted small metal-binding protein